MRTIGAAAVGRSTWTTHRTGSLARHQDYANCPSVNEGVQFVTGARSLPEEEPRI
jgi:hypothetical protein